MIGKIEELLRRVEEFCPKTAAEVEEFRIKVLGKKGELNALMEEFKRVAPELKREVGQRLNALNRPPPSGLPPCAPNCRRAGPTMPKPSAIRPVPVRPSSSGRAIRFRW